MVDKEPIESGDAYYEGVSTQPGHVGAGLVVPRPELLSDVLAGLEMSQAVLLAGPSGVGKSAVLWTLPFARPGVLWLRVHRISEGDLPYMMRLLHAYGASPKTPVGLLVDAAGRGDLEGWSRLRQSVAAVPGALLVGTARSEDLFSLGDLADCRIVKVSLDEKAASRVRHATRRRRPRQRIFSVSHRAIRALPSSRPQGDETALRQPPLPRNDPRRVRRPDRKLSSAYRALIRPSNESAIGSGASLAELKNSGL